MKKKTLKTVLISVAAAAVVAAVIVLAVLFGKDAHGMNAFERGKVVASAGGHSVTMGEYVTAIDNSVSIYIYLGWTIPADEMKEMQENTIEGLLLQKIYPDKLSELGLSLTAEELAECKQAAVDELKELETSIGSQLSKNGNFSNANLQSQINEYFARTLGMTKSQYKARIETQQKANKAYTKIEAYYADQMKDFTEEELLAYYEKYVTETYADSFEAGKYSEGMEAFREQSASLPYLYVPETFLYVDVVTISAATEDEINEFYAQLENGASFDDLKQDGRNTTAMYVAGYDGPYAIGEGDDAYVANYDKLYALASGLNEGETALAIEAAEDGASYTGYIVLRTEGATGIVDIDRYAGVKDTVSTNFETERFNEIVDSWIADKTVDEVIYTYTGTAA